MRNLSILSVFIFLILSCSSKKDTTSKVGLYNSEIGVQAYSFRNYFPKDMIGTLDKIQEMGITLIEGDGGRIPPEEFKKLCADRGISIPSTGAGFQDLSDRPMEIVDKAQKLGAKYVMCAWIPHAERGNFTLEDAKKAVEVFNSAGNLLAESGLTLAYHPHGYEFQPYGDETLLDYIIKNTDPKYVSFEMDVMWIHFGGGDPVDLLERYGNRWKLMHLKDLKSGTPKDLTGGTDVENNVVLGQGELDFPGIFRAAKKAGVDYYFIEDESSSVMDQIPASISYLKSL